MDEIFLSTLLHISSPTPFVNDCRLDNKGENEIDPMKPIIQEGFVYSFVPPILQTEIFLKYVLVKPETEKPSPDNTIEWMFFNYLTNYGAWWRTFPEIYQLNSDEFNSQYRFVSNGIFDLDAYYRRLDLVTRPFLLDSNERAKSLDKMAVIIVPKLEVFLEGEDHINKLILMDYVYNFIQTLEDLAIQGLVNNISDVLFNNFTDFPNEKFEWLKEGLEKKYGGPLRHAYHRTFINPTDKDAMEEIVGEWYGMVLVFGVPWKGNSYPGNEYWSGSQDGTITRSATACSTLGEAQNPQINPWFLERFQVY